MTSQNLRNTLPRDPMVVLSPAASIIETMNTTSTIEKTVLRISITILRS